MTVSKEHKILIEKAIGKLFNSAAIEIIPLAGGISSSALYQVTLEHQSIVARLCDPNNPYTNLATEYHNMSIAADHDIAPKVYYTDSKTGLALMEYIETQALTHVFDHQENIESLAKLMKKIHSAPKFQARDPAIDLPWKIQSILPADIAKHPMAVNAIDLLKRLAPSLRDPEDIKPCHCDVNKSNLLFNGTRFYWVDWTTSSMDNFYFDLAMIINLFFYDSEQKSEHFLRTYFLNNISPNQQHKIELMRQVVYIYMGILLLYGSNLQKVDLLSQNEIDSLPDYIDLMHRLDCGKIDLTLGESQQQLGWAFLKYVEV